MFLYDYVFLIALIKITTTIGNDPSAGSPTETLLRLLLPLNVQVWASFQTQRCYPVKDSCTGQSEDLTKTFNR